MVDDAKPAQLGERVPVAGVDVQPNEVVDEGVAVEELRLAALGHGGGHGALVADTDRVDRAVEVVDAVRDEAIEPRDVDGARHPDEAQRGGVRGEAVLVGDDTPAGPVGAGAGHAVAAHEGPGRTGPPLRLPEGGLSGRPRCRVAASRRGSRRRRPRRCRWPGGRARPRRAVRRDAPATVVPPPGPPGGRRPRRHARGGPRLRGDRARSPRGPTAGRWSQRRLLGALPDGRFDLALVSLGHHQGHAADDRRRPRRGG